MKVSVLQDKLAKGLGIVARAVENRPTLPVLGNVLVATEERPPLQVDQWPEGERPCVAKQPLPNGSTGLG